MSLSRPVRPRLLDDFLIFHLDMGTFRDKLYWVDRRERKFRIAWRHQSSSRFTEEDSSVFQAWAIAKHLWDPNDSKCHTKAKQRLRAALLKLRSVVCVEKDNESRVYQITKRQVQQENHGHDQFNYVSQNPPFLPFSPEATHQYEDSSTESIPPLTNSIDEEEMNIDRLIEQILKPPQSLLQENFMF